jgi:hypothetical protein
LFDIDMVDAARQSTWTEVMSLGGESGEAPLLPHTLSQFASSGSDLDICVGELLGSCYNLNFDLWDGCKDVKNDLEVMVLF